MKTEPSVTNVDDAKLAALIGAAERRVLLLAPGLSEPVAVALRDAWAHLGGSAVSVILDVDPEVCRLGYGTLEGLQIVRDAAARARALVCHQPGVRIGLVISDDTTVIFSPTPLLIEAGSTQPDRPNAIRLQAPPEEIAKEVGLGEHPDKERVVGLDPVEAAKIEAVAQDLACNPPVKFDLARRVRVFTSRFQFVELEMTGCFLSRKRVPIPSRLMGLAKDTEVQSQFHAHFNLVHGTRLRVQAGDKVLTEESLRRRKESLVKDYLIPLKGYGSVVLRANKDKLIAAVDALKTDVTAFQDGIKADLQKHMDSSAAALVNALLPAVVRSPPESYTKIHGPGVSDAQLRQLLSEDIKRAFGNGAKLVQEMKVSLVFKDLAYESLVDKSFLEVARKAMPGVEFLHDEYDAAQAVGEEE
jgi:hypothetical protein